jgi:hypothetical protein
MRRALLFLLVLTCTACRTTGTKTPNHRERTVRISKPPIVQPFARAGYFKLVRPLTVLVGEGADSLVVPEGFVTDFASIPRRFQGFISKLGPHLCPAIVHDYLYWEQACTRSESDAIFLEMMKDLGVPWLTRHFMHFAVRRFGGSAWKENRQNREEGMPRVIPPQARAIEATETWIRYREYLRTMNGHSSPAPVVSKGFCSYPKMANGGAL